MQERYLREDALRKTEKTTKTEKVKEIKTHIESERRRLEEVRVSICFIALTHILEFLALNTQIAKQDKTRSKGIICTVTNLQYLEG